MAEGAGTVAIVGAGLGGLLSGAYLARAGYRVELFEPMGFVGGKFTSLDRDGFAVPTGAFHTLPGGYHGPLARACAELGIDLQLHISRPAFYVRRGDQRWPVRRSPFVPDTYWQTLPRGDRLRLAAAMAALLATPLLPEVSFERWLRLHRVPEATVQALGRIVTFSIGVPIGETSVRDLAGSMWAQRWHSEGIVRGGVKAIVTALADLIKAHGGRIRRGLGVRSIIVEHGRARGVVTDRGERVDADLVVSGAGLAVSCELLGGDCPAPLAELRRRAVPAWGASLSVRSREPLLPHAGIEVPLDGRWLSGYLQVSAGEPELAPDGWHYLLAYQVLRRGAHDPREVRAGIAELRALFPAVCAGDVFHVSVFRDGWPAARLGQGLAHHGPGRCPVVCPGIERLYLVSHDSAGYGFAAEVIGSAAAQMMRHLAQGRSR